MDGINVSISCCQNHESDDSIHIDSWLSQKKQSFLKQVRLSNVTNSLISATLLSDINVFMFIIPFII